MKYVIIGNSAAGIGAIEGIRQVDKLGEITVVTSEPHHTYSRPLISYLLLGKTDEDKMKYRGDDFYAENRCTLIHATATGIGAESRRVELHCGKQIPYDKLLVATGSSAFVPPFEGLDTVSEKTTFMCLDDARKLDALLGGGPAPLCGDSPANKRVLIVGAGLIGLKCAEGIARRAFKITVLDLAPQILSSILDEDGAKMVQSHLEKNGIEFRLSANIKRFDGNAAILAGNADTDTPILTNDTDADTAPVGDGVLDVPPDGERIDFDILVLAVGVRPNTALLNGIAEIQHGIIVNEKSKTTAPDIYAAGDCTQTTDISSGQSKIMALLPNAYLQGECAGINMAAGADADTPKSFDKAIPMNAIGFFGLHIVTAGNYGGEIFAETYATQYKRLFFAENKLNGYIIIGDVAKAGIYTSLIRERTSLDSIDFALICQKPGLMAFTKEARSNKLGEAK